MFCVISYHFCNLKNVKMVHGGVTLLHGRFSRFLNCANVTKSRNASHIKIFHTCRVFIGTTTPTLINACNLRFSKNNFFMSRVSKVSQVLLICRRNKAYN